MTNHQDQPTFEQVVKLARKLDSKRRLLVLRELVNTLNCDLVEELKIKVEQTIVLSELEEPNELEQVPTQPSNNFEIKRIQNKHYAYLRCREDGYYKFKYLGPMPLIPGNTYTLASKVKTNTTKTLTPLGLEIEGDQIYLKVKLLKPINTIKSYRYPDCLDTVFSKKEWRIQKVIPPQTVLST